MPDYEPIRPVPAPTMAPDSTITGLGYEQPRGNGVLADTTRGMGFGMATPFLDQAPPEGEPERGRRPRREIIADVIRSSEESVAGMVGFGDTAIISATRFMITYNNGLLGTWYEDFEARYLANHPGDGLPSCMSLISRLMSVQGTLMTQIKGEGLDKTKAKLTKEQYARQHQLICEAVGIGSMQELRDAFRDASEYPEYDEAAMAWGNGPTGTLTTGETQAEAMGLETSAALMMVSYCSNGGPGHLKKIQGVLAGMQGALAAAGDEAAVLALTTGAFTKMKGLYPNSASQTGLATDVGWISEQMQGWLEGTLYNPGGVNLISALLSAPASERRLIAEQIVIGTWAACNWGFVYYHQEHSVHAAWSNMWSITASDPNLERSGDTFTANGATIAIDASAVGYAEDARESLGTDWTGGVRQAFLLQERLRRDYGCEIETDGAFGPKSQEAVKQVQAQLELAQTGIPNRAFLAAVQEGRGGKGVRFRERGVLPPPVSPWKQPVKPVKPTGRGGDLTFMGRSQAPDWEAPWGWGGPEEEAPAREEETWGRGDWEEEAPAKQGLPSWATGSWGFGTSEEEAPAVEQELVFEENWLGIEMPVFRDKSAGDDGFLERANRANGRARSGEVHSKSTGPIQHDVQSQINLPVRHAVPGKRPGLPNAMYAESGTLTGRPSLKVGMDDASGKTGGQIAALQRVLKKEYGLEVATTGKFDAETEKAVRVAQGLAGTSVDGVVGPTTAAALVTGRRKGSGAVDPATFQAWRDTPAAKGIGEKDVHVKTPHMNQTLNYDKNAKLTNDPSPFFAGVGRKDACLEAARVMAMQTGTYFGNVDAMNADDELLMFSAGDKIPTGGPYVWGVAPGQLDRRDEKRMAEVRARTLDGVAYIDAELDAGRSVVVGVAFAAYSINRLPQDASRGPYEQARVGEGRFDHGIVINGRKGGRYEFLDPGRSAARQQSLILDADGVLRSESEEVGSPWYEVCTVFKNASFEAEPGVEKVGASEKMK